MNNSGDIKDKFPYQIDEFYLDLQNDGSRIAILEEDEIVKKPFPGLRPFKTSEFQLFKGRSGQAEELIKRLSRNKLLAVIGSSGTGKSSLVRAGLIPQLLGGYLHESGHKWNIAICRPGKNPVENLSIALSSIKSKGKEKDKIIKEYKIIEPLLSNSIYGILDVNELLNPGDKKEEQDNLLIIIDQFEELFRFDRKDLGRENIETHFVNLLLKAVSNPESSVYVIITMRSEFLGDCVKFRGLPEAINEGQYLVPQLNRTQLKEAIEGPIHLAGKNIDPGLVELLINEIDENKLKENLDQLPILQHALMRSYNKATNEGSEVEIEYRHYELIGGMTKALANHAEAKYAELDDENNSSGAPSKKQSIARIIFQALTDTSTDKKGGRRPTELTNIYNIASSLDASDKEVDEVVNHFRENETSFIMPPINTTLHPNLVLDISHESLMRNWEKLTSWMNEEAQNGRLYKMLNERRLLNEQSGGNDELIRGGLLAEMLGWEKQRHNSAWASRYHLKADLLKNNETNDDAYHKNLDFLHYSRDESIRIRNLEKTNLKIRQAKKYRVIITWILTAALIISTAFGILAWTKEKRADSLATEAMIYREIAEGEKDEANRLTFETNIKLRKWWNDPYLTDNTKEQIKDSLVNWYFNNPSYQHSILAEKMDYSLRIMHEAENRKKKNYSAYLQLLSYAQRNDKNIATNLVPNNLNQDYNNDTTLLKVNNKIGIDYYNERNYSGAAFAFNANLKIDSGKIDSSVASWWNMIGNTLFAIGKYDDAIIKYKKANDLDRHNSAYLENLGAAYIANRDYKLAESFSNKAIEIDQNDANAWKSSGKSLYEQGRFKDAATKFKRAIKIDNASFDNYSLLAKTYRILNEPDSVKKYLTLLKNLTIKKYYNLFVLAGYYDDSENINKENFKNAIYWYKKYIGKGNKIFWQSYNNIALDYCRVGEYDKAIAYADSTIHLIVRQSELTENQLELAGAIVINPPNPYAHKGYAYLKKQTNKSTKDTKNLIIAKIYIDKAFSIDSNYAKTYFYYACYWALLDYKKESINNLNKAISKGFTYKKWIDSEEMLNPIRKDKEYIELMHQLKDYTTN